MASLFDESCRQKLLEEPMPLIGGYIATASAVLLILMVADTWNVWKTKKIWFPCKYFSLNGTSLTLLRVAMKFIMDISTFKFEEIDRLTIVSSLTLMSTSISNFMISLASMDNNGIMLNLSALIILFVTVYINMILLNSEPIRIIPGHDWFALDDWNSLLVLAIIVSLILYSLAYMVPTTKRCIQLEFQERHKIVWRIEYSIFYVAITHFQELPKCWSLAIATLTKIAISLPDISNNQVDQLVSNVSECISFVKFIEETNDMKGQFANVRKAGSIVWGEVELYRQKMQKGTLQDLSTTASKKFIDFKSSKPDSVLRNHNWPPKVIAANSMYRICQTISLAGNQSDSMIFEQVSTIVSNILAASLKNLPHALRIKCQTDIIEKSEESIQKAAIILGESKEVIEFLAQHEWKILDHETTGIIEAWQVTLEQGA